MVAAVFWIAVPWPAIGHAGQHSDSSSFEGSTCTGDG